MPRDWEKSIQEYGELKDALERYLKDHGNVFEGTVSELARQLGCAERESYGTRVATSSFRAYITAMAGEGVIGIEQDRNLKTPTLSMEIKITLLKI